LTVPPAPRSLTLSGVSRRYGAVQALDGVTLTLQSGQVHALMGENGAGKSTMIRVLAGLERPDAGTLALDGATLSPWTPAAAQAAGLRVLHQELQVVPALSVAENMHLAQRLPTRFGLVRWGALNRAARAALDRLGLSRIDPRAPISDLGHGDRMLVRIAATLLDTGAGAPWLYVLDEPTAALTGTEAERLFAVIDELRAGGAAILYVSHRMAEVLRLADHVSVLRDGQLVRTGPASMTGQDQIIHDMTGRALSGLFAPGDTPAAPPTGAPPVLSVRGLSSGPLRGIDLDLAPGQVLGIAGLAGSGRGALLRALIGATPRRGQVDLAGRTLPAGRPAAAWAAGLAYVPRERRSEGLVLAQSIAHNIALPHLARLSHGGVIVSPKREMDQARHLAAEVRLKATSPAQPCAELSGGNQQKVLFARAMAGSPRVLLLDEPTRGVDIGARADLYRLIRRAGDAGMGVILASTDLPELLGLADDIVVLRAGRIAHRLPAAGLTEAGLLRLCHEDAPPPPLPTPRPAPRPEATCA